MQNLSRLAKKTLSVFLATVLVLSCFSSALGVVASAADEIGEPWDGTTATQPAQAEDGYYLISNGAELAWLRNQVVNNVDRSINGRLTANINLDNKVWEPIGNNSRQYAGTFDGQGYTISNLTVTSTSVDRGLFGKITTSAVIKNININDVTITTVRDYAGGVVGVAVGGTISNCHVKGINIATTKAYVGGIVGYVSGATVISGCTVTGTSSMKTLSGSAYIGGILGEIRANNVVISDCVVDNLNISGTSSDTRIAGAVGNAAYRFSMYDCLVKNVNVTGVKKVGGLAFVIRTGSVIERCGVIDSTLTATQTSASTDTEIGGLIAVVTDSTINTVQYCYVYNTTVSTYGRVSGGFIGKVETARHILSENYCAAELILKASPTRAGSLIGWASTGEYNDMYYVPNGSQAYIGEKASAAVLNNVASITDSEAKNGTLLNNLNARTNIWKEGDDGYPVIDRLLAAEPATDENGVYLIATAYHLEWFRKHVNSGNTTKNARLIADIDLNNKRIEPIGADSVRYAGIFDGDGFIISNLNMLTPGSYRGLFGSTTPTAVIKNLNLKNVYIDTNGDFVGSAVGMLRGRAENITVEGVNVTANAKAGGVVGEMQNGAVISNVSVQGTETANIIKTTSTNVGGVVGNIYTSASYVNNAVAKNLNITGTERVSGIAGDVSTDGSSVGHFDTVLVEDVNITATSRYAGGVVFNLRNASTVTRATIRNVRITGSAQIGGITGTTAGDGGKITDSLVENYTGVSTGEETGGIVGYINSKTTITDTIIKDSSITGKRYLGGVSYTLKNGSVLSRVGVINVTVTATDTSTSNEQRVGGLIGYVTGSPANTVQYCYVTDTSVSSTGRMTGGFIGYSGSSAHFITENYANAEVITTGKIYAGSFLGRRSTGKFLDNFSTLTSGTTLVGSATAGVAGDATGISEVPMSDVRNGNLVNTLNAITDVWAQINDDYVNGYPVISKAQPPELVDGYYEITNTFQLEWFRNQVNNFGELTANAKLMTDLNLNGKEWVPIANNSSRYNGTFDGQGHSISNFKINNNASYIGLFGAINTAAVIKDLTVKKVKITSTGTFVGAVVGMSKGRMENITVEGVEINAASKAGGAIGELQLGAVVTNISVFGTADGSSIITTSSHAGGVIGNAYNSTYYITNATAKNLTIRASERAGGILGDISSEGTSIAHLDTVLVEDVNITATTQYAGGVLFNLRNGSSINRATVRNVTVSSKEEIGAITGATAGSGTNKLSNSLVENYTGIASDIESGGIIGNAAYKVEISDCIIKDSTITGKRYIGGVSYILTAGSTATRIGVINVTINATDTSASNEQRVGGLFGYIGSSVNKVQYCYVTDSVITSAASRYVGGFIGYSASANHIVTENYVNADVNTVGNIYTGSFLGRRATGTFTNNFARTVEGKPLVGSATAGVAGNTAGITEISIEDVRNGNLTEMLNNITDIWAQHGEDYVNGYPEFANAEPPQLVDGYYQISTGFQLEWFANFVNANNTTANAKLLNDINLRGKEWVVIGTDSVRFNGIFDGQGHTISNFKITKNASHLGLIGATNAAAVIKDLNVKQVKITTTGTNVGAVVGTLRGRAENIAVEGVEISANTTAGGAFGEINTNTKVYNVSVLGTADGKTIATNANNSGGVIGNIVGTNEIKNVSAKNLNISGSERLGGIVGDLSTTGTAKADIDNVTVEDVNITAPRYAGGVIYNLKNGSTLSNVSVKNVTITGTEEFGGVAGTTTGSAVKVSNVLVENFTCTATGERIGGIIGYIRIKTTMTDCIIKDSSITGKRFMGGVSYTLQYGSIATRVGVVNVNITATDATASNEQRVGGLIGYVTGSSANTVQYCYVTDSVITSAAGRMTGGLIGSSITSNHSISETYVNAQVNTVVKIYSGSFIGNRATGYISNNFVAALNDLPMAGSATAGVAGNTAGITEVAPEDVRNGNLKNTLNGITDIWTQYNDDYENGYPVILLANAQAPELVDGYYEIYTSFQLEWFRDQVNNQGYLTANAKLMANLNLGGKEWAPIANNSSRYNGTFDGQGYSISNFRITNNSSYLGLFGAINTAAVIKDLAINNVKITSTGSYVGGVVGMSKGRTENITVEGVDISANTRAGGVIGEMQAGASAANLTVLGTEGANSITTSSTHAGGVIGSAYNSTFYLNNITAKNLVVRGNERTGGIMGDIHNEGTSIAHFDTVLVENVSVTSTARYSGGVLFNLRNGSSMTNATVRNVTVTATEEVGGIAGAVGGSGTSTLSNSVVENFTGVASGEKAGGLVGTLNIKLIVSDCIVKDSSVTAKRYLGGIAYTLYNGSTATRVGVINTEITATDTSSSNEQRIGGLFGVLNGTAVTLQYSYIIDSTIKATAGTRIGGAIGTSITNNHTVRYNYVANTSVSPRNAYSGSFLGNRSTGTFTSNFVYNCSDLPLVGSSTAGNAGNVTGVSKVEIFADDIPSAETATLINYYTANKGFIDSFENADVAFLKDEVFSDVYNELLEVLSEIRAELSARLDAEIQVLRDLYDEFDMVCIFNYEMIGLNLGTVTTDIATKIDLLPETQENYDFYLWLVNEYNTYLANHGYNSFYEATVGFMPRLVRENDIARYESPRDDFPVTYEKMQNVVNKLDALLLGEDFATLAGLDSDISGMIKETLQEELYTDEMVNDLMGNIYPAFIEALEEAIEENARIDIGVTTISLRGKARDILEDLLDKFGLRVYPNDLAGAIDSKYASIKSILSSAGEDWSKVNFEDPDSPKYLHWGITDKDSFIDAFANSLAGIYPVLRAALTRNAFDQKKSSSVIANIDVEVRLRISAVDAYDKAVLPLFEMINVTGFMPADEYNGITNVKGLISNVFDPLLTFIEEELPSAPFSNLMEILPNIAHCLEFGLVESWLKTLKTKVSYDINGVFDYWLGDIDFNITDGTYDFDVCEMLSEDEDGILYGADLSSLTGLVKILTNFLDVDVELPPINSKYLASLGTVVQLDSATRNLTRYYIMGDSAKVSYVALKYIFELLGNEDFIKAVIEEFGDEEDLEDIDEKLNGTIGDIARNIAANPYDAIAAIAELCNPVEYEVRSLDYGNPLDGEFAKVTYSQYWTKQQATYVSDHLDEYINDILKLFGMKPAGEILREKLGELYTNDTLTSLIIGAREALDELDEDDKILTVLDVDISPWDEIEEGYDWGFADGDKDGFLAALCAALSPLNNAVGLFLADMDYTIMDGEITVKGYNGYQTAIVPLLEALGCDYEDILTGDEYLAAVAQDPNSMIELIIRPIFELLERVYAAPTETLFSILPNLIYFLESGVLDTAILNMVQPILVVIDTIRPIYDIEFEFSARDFVVEAINDLALENGITLPDINLSDMLKAYAATRTNVHGEEIYVIDADNADVMTVMLRYIVTTLFCPDNIGLIKTALVDESGLTGNNAAVLKAIIDSFADLINAPDGADKVLGSLYFIFKGSEQGFGEANDFLDNFNHYWTEFLNMLSGSESEYIRGFADAVKALLSQYLDGVIDEGGLAPNGIVKFFQSIAEFFRNFFDMIRNLFR